MVSHPITSSPAHARGDAQPVPHRESKKPVRIKRLTLDLPEPLHRAIKISAAQEGVTMAEKLRALLMKHYGVKADSV